MFRVLKITIETSIKSKHTVCRTYRCDTSVRCHTYKSLHGTAFTIVQTVHVFLWKKVFTVWYFVSPVDPVTICLLAVSWRRLWLLTHYLFSTWVLNSCQDLFFFFFFKSSCPQLILDTPGYQIPGLLCLMMCMRLVQYKWICMLHVPCASA